ncbi:MAG: hypothetical protein HYX84_02315 [Chloroflexi bacterium]|nr:hypothetical protein [Chloroflexota bacterium]
MKQLVLDLITTCENRISIIEELITGAFYSMTTMNTNLAEVAGERTRLENTLQVLLAKNCTLRKKDFESLTKGIRCRYEKDLTALETDRIRIGEGLNSYLDELKQSVCNLHQQLAGFIYGKGDTIVLETTMGMIEAAYRHGGQQAFASLRYFQARLESFRREQKEINMKLQKLVGMGETLRTEDLRQLQAGEAARGQNLPGDCRQKDVQRLYLTLSVSSADGNPEQ